MKLLVTGANGFLGSRCCKMALERGWEVAAMTRASSDLSLIKPLLEAERIEWRVGDLAAPSTHAACVQGQDAIVNAAAATSEHSTSLDDSRAVNVEGTRTFLEAALQAGVRRVAHVSSQSAHPGNRSAYGRAKLESEAAVKGSGLAWTILRPGVIYGPEERGVFHKLEGHVQNLPVVPVIGSGLYVQYPVHVADVAGAALDCLENEACAGKTFDIAGADALPFLEVLRAVMEAKGVRKATPRLPVWLCRLIAFSSGLVLRDPPLTRDNIEGLLTAPPLDNGPAREAFGYAPRGFREGFQKSLEERRAAADE
jgi:NADH dehydrogenase